MTVIGQPPRPRTARPRVTRRQRWMLVLAFEVLVYGFAQAAYHPVKPAGIVVETTVTPNHVVT